MSSELFKTVQEAIAEVLDLELDEVKMESNLITDLDAESIDLLDISSELEKVINKEVDLSKLRVESEEEPSLTVEKLVHYVSSL